MTGPQDSQTSESLDGPTRLTSLPPEILRSILEFALPQGLVVGFQDDWPWRVLIANSRSNTGSVFDGGHMRHIHDSYGCHVGWSHSWCEVHFDFALFAVNRAIATEARAVFFTGNTFEFGLDTIRYYPLPIEPPYIFGLLGKPHLIHILRDLRHVELDLPINGTSHHGFKHVQSQLQLFVATLNKSHDDPTKSSLLETLKLNVTVPPYTQRSNSVVLALHKCIFALEVLTDLKKPLIQLKSSSLLPAWFSSCLALQLTGRGGRSAATLTWPTKVVKSSPDMYGKRKRAKVVETRTYWQPRLDWREFAARNGVEMPEDADGCFPPL